MTIREFRDGDMSGVVAIARELQTHESLIYDRLVPPEEIGAWYVERLRADVTKASGVILVAEVRDLIAGYATLLTELSSAHERDEVPYTYSHIGDLAVAKSHRDRGIGRALVGECERRAKAAGQKWLRLDVLAPNASARRFYRQLGYCELSLTLEKTLS